MEMARRTPEEAVPEPASGSRIPTANSDPASPYLVDVPSKSRREYCHLAVVASLIVIIMTLLIAIIIIVFKAGKCSNKCETKECLRTAASLLQTMDQTIEPCEDFYRFTCGNWAEEHPQPESLASYNWFMKRRVKIIQKIRKFLQENETYSDSQTVKKVKTMYRACTDTENLENLGVKPILNYLKKLDLPIIPALLNKSLENSTIPYQFDWIRSIVKIKKTLGMDVLIGFDIEQDPRNRSVSNVVLSSPNVKSALLFNDNEDYKRLNKEKRKMIMKLNDDESLTDNVIRMVSEIILAADPDIKLGVAMENLNNAAKEVFRIIKKINKFNEIAENSTNISENSFLYLNLTELQIQIDETITPKTTSIWNEYLNQIMNGTEFDSSSEKIRTSKSDIKYFQLTVEFLSETHQLKNIEYYIWWCVVRNLAIHTTETLRNHVATETTESASRYITCADEIRQNMGMAVISSIINPKFLKETLPRIERMLSNIRQSFNYLVATASWMDEDTKNLTREKALSMKSFIGYPEWIMNTTRLDAFYSGITVNATTHLDNLIGLRTWEMAQKLQEVKEFTEILWNKEISSVNAFYLVGENNIIIPITMLEYPLYKHGLEALNYGAIGTILGHELTHGFDNVGRMFDKTGNIRQWWSNKTIEEFVNRTKCFVKQYGAFYIPDAGAYIDGELTLGENIADNGGLRQAYYAYKTQIQQSGPEAILPGLENYTHEQLFFIAFGNLWCESGASTKEDLKDPHCPAEIRVKGVLANSEEFSNAFGCKRGSGMFPTEDRCKLW